MNLNHRGDIMSVTLKFFFDYSTGSAEGGVSDTLWIVGRHAMVVVLGSQGRSQRADRDRMHGVGRTGARSFHAE
jgi:hypothetical protein